MFVQTMLFEQRGRRGLIPGVRLLREWALRWWLVKPLHSLTRWAACDNDRVFETSHALHQQGLLLHQNRWPFSFFFPPLFYFPKSIARYFITATKEGENVLIRNMHKEQALFSFAFITTHELVMIFIVSKSIRKQINMIKNQFKPYYTECIYSPVQFSPQM